MNCSVENEHLPGEGRKTIYRRKRMRILKVRRKQRELRICSQRTVIHQLRLRLL